jgi:hypothetical protein
MPNKVIIQDEKHDDKRSIVVSGIDLQTHLLNNLSIYMQQIPILQEENKILWARVKTRV